jgi:gliding motility-associated-like protein
MRLILKLLFFVLIFVLPTLFYSQTLIINEFSNGPAGAQEYIEFIVVDDNAFYDCGNSAPPCVDIRGWIIDDNSGYHGAGGVAAGCNRFSNNSFWQCIPIGTIITVYNDVERNGSLPPDDLLMSDNNCRLIIPINNTQLFENNATTPGAVACSYPATGWIAGGNWSRIGMANTGDCARLVNLAGCEVSSLCYGDVSLNTQVYFLGNGADNVWSFSDGNSTVQANWAEGCADNETLLDAGTCGANDQTPGVANNALNIAYIAQFNNNCQPILPLSLTVTGTTSQTCVCDGSASISASGSIGPYTYVWYDQFNIPLGQTTSTANNLCSGNYYCVVTSSIDCKDTIPVFVGSICSNFGTFATATMIQNCVNNQFYNTTWANLPDQINPSGILFDAYDYGPYFQNSNTLILRGGEVKTFKNPGANVCGAKLNYTIYTVGNQPANPVFTVLDLPFKESCTVGPNSFPTGGPCFNATDQKWAKENYNIDLTTLAPGNYVLEVYYSVPGSFTSTAACNDTIYVNNNGMNYKALFQIKPTPNITASSLNICPGNNATLTSNYANGNSWTGGSTNQSITVNSSGTTTLTVSLNNNCPNQTDTETINVYAAPTVEAGVNQSTCGSNGVTLSGVIGGSATGSQWVSPSGTFSNANSLNTTFTPTISSGIATVILSATGPCPTVQDQLVVLVNANPTVNAGADQTICAGNSITISGTYGGSANASSWSAPSGTFGNITNLNTTFTPTITSGSITLTLSASGPCPTVTDQLILTVNPLPTSNAGADQSICAGTNLILSGAIAGSATSGIWSGGTGTFSPNASALNATYTPSASEISAGTISLTLTSDDPIGPCIAATDQLTVTIDPIATVNAGSDQTICSNSNATLSGSIGGSATNATWSGGSGTFTPNATTLNASYTPSAAEILAGSVILTLTTNDPVGTCSAVSDNVSINFNQAATANAGADQSICAGTNLILSGAIAGSATSGIWSGGTGTFSPNASSLNATYTPSALEISAGTISLTLTSDDPIGPCIAAADQLTVTIDPIATVNAGSDQTICSNSNATLSGSIGGSATNATWSGGTGTFTPNATTLNASYTPSAAEILAGSVILTLTTNDPVGTCSAVSDNVSINFNQAATANAGADQSICAGTNLILSGAIAGSATSGIWSGGTGTFFPNASALNATYTPSASEISAGTISLTLTSDDPIGPCITAADQLTVTIDPIATVNAGSDQTICSNSNATLSGSIGGSATNATWSGGSGTFTPNATTLNASYTPSAAEILAGSVILTFTTNDPVGTCSAVSDNIVLTINAAPVVNAGNDISVCLGGTVALNASISGTNTGGIWSASTGTFSNLNSLTSNYTPSISSGNVSLTLTSTGPCPAVNDAVVINIIQPTVPNFTQQGPYCIGATFSLPNTSINGVFGTWSPITNNLNSTNYTFTPNSGQCATSTSMNVTIIPNQSSSISFTVCPSQIPYTWNGLTFSGPGSQTANLTNINGCDSSVTLNLSVSNIITSNTSLTICPTELPYSWNGLIFNSAGLQSVSLTSSSGCDSIASLNLIVSTPQSSNSNLTICSSQLPYSWNGLIFNNSGSQSVILQDINGCDSSAILNLQVQNTLTSTTTMAICPIELPYSWNNIVLNGAGTQSVTLTSTGGCDSIATIVLSINPTYNTNELVTICENETPFSWNGLTFSNTTTQSLTLQTVNGCDSVVALNLTVLPSTLINLDSTICSDLLPFTWNGLIFSAAGTQSVTLTDMNGCDSTITYHLAINSLPQIISFGEGNQYCEGDAINDITAQVNGTGPYTLSFTYNGSNISITSSSGQFNLGNLPGNYTINSISDLNCQNDINDQTEIIQVNPIPLTPIASSDAEYCLNIQPNSITVNGNQNAIFFWYNNPNLSNVIGQGSSYVPLSNQGITTYYVVQQENGCLSTPDSVIVTFNICDIIIPTAFTPDNDNVNDSWSLTGIDLLYPKNVVTIYNRWGNVIFLSEPGTYELSPWNGTYNNEQMPVGSYYFIIEYGETFKQNQTGIVTIIK